jgi:hypothetical protein
MGGLSARLRDNTGERAIAEGWRLIRRPGKRHSEDHQQTKTRQVTQGREVVARGAVHEDSLTLIDSPHTGHIRANADSTVAA